MFIHDTQGQLKLVGLQEVGQQVEGVCAELHWVAHGACSLRCAVRGDLSLLGDALQVIQLLYRQIEVMRLLNHLCLPYTHHLLLS